MTPPLATSPKPGAAQPFALIEVLNVRGFERDFFYLQGNRGGYSVFQTGASRNRIVFCAQQRTGDGVGIRY